MLRKSVYWPKAKVASYHEEEFDSSLNDDEVLIANHYSLISQSSEKEWLASDRSHSVLGTTFPLIPGYSVAGYVFKVGGKVTNVKLGDKVIASPETGLGGHANWVITKSRNVFKVANKVNLDDAVFFNLDATGIYSIHRAQLQLGQSIAIIGVGVVGKAALQTAKASGAYLIIAIDPRKENRQFALSHGADYAFAPDDQAIRELLINLDDHGVDVALDCSGSLAGINASLDYARPFGKAVWCSGTQSSQMIDYGKVFVKELTVLGAFIGDQKLIQQCYREFLLMLENHQLAIPEHNQMIYEPTDENIKNLYGRVLAGENLGTPIFKWRKDNEKF